MSLGFCFVNSEKTVNSVVYVTPLEEVNDGSEVERFWGTEKGIRETSFAQQSGKVYYIRTAGQLAYMSYVISSAGAIDPSGSSWDFAGSTFVLENDINLNLKKEFFLLAFRNHHSSFLLSNLKFVP